MQWSDAVQDALHATQNISVNTAVLQKLWQSLDLTNLNDHDTENEIALMLEKAESVYGHVAAVCVYPKFVRMAHAQFEEKPIRIATVANFPSGEKPIIEVLEEINRALQCGADEIDVVFPYQRFLAGDRQYAHTFVESCKAACGTDVTLKVILETSALQTLNTIADAASEALRAGADFIKTSTGKLAQGATLEAASVMLLVIKNMTPQLNRPLGFKAAGGVKQVEQAAQYLALAHHIMGSSWPTVNTFRIGASQLADEILQTKTD